MATDPATLMAQAKCYQCADSGQWDLIELALLKQLVLAYNPAADTSPQGLMNQAACFECLNAGQMELAQMVLLSQISNQLNNNAIPTFPAVRFTTTQPLKMIMGSGSETGGQSQPEFDIPVGVSTWKLDQWSSGPGVVEYSFTIGFADTINLFNNSGSTGGTGGYACLFESDDAPDVWQAVNIRNGLTSSFSPPLHHHDRFHLCTRRNTGYLNRRVQLAQSHMSVDLTAQGLMNQASCYQCLLPGQRQLAILALLSQIVQGVQASSTSCLLCGVVDPTDPPGCNCAIYYNRTAQSLWDWDSDNSVWVPMIQ